MLTKTGALKRLDSVAVIDLVVGIEKEFSITIPPAELLPEVFENLERLASLVERMNASAGGR